LVSPWFKVIFSAVSTKYAPLTVILQYTYVAWLNITYPVPKVSLNKLMKNPCKSCPGLPEQYRPKRVRTKVWKGGGSCLCSYQHGSQGQYHQITKARYSSFFHLRIQVSLYEKKKAIAIACNSINGRLMWLADIFVGGSLFVHQGYSVF